MIRLLCGEDRHEVQIKNAGGTLQARVDGRALDEGLSIEETAPGTYALRRGDAVETFHCVRDGASVHLFWRGRVHVLELEGEGGRSAQRHQGGGLESPMPGKVIAVKAAPGQKVTKGEELLVVESMKMENAIRAPRDGVVKSVAAHAGDMVGPGIVLVELE